MTSQMNSITGYNYCKPLNLLTLVNWHAYCLHALFVICYMLYVLCYMLYEYSPPYQNFFLDKFFFIWYNNRLYQFFFKTEKNRYGKKSVI